MGDERRRSARAERGLLVRYRPAGASGAAWLLSPLRDLSSGGAHFVSEQPFTVGERLELQLILPTAPQPIGLAARVAWAKPLPERLTELGVSFNEVDPLQRQALEDAVAQFVRKQEDG